MRTLILLLALASSAAAQGVVDYSSPTPTNYLSSFGSAIPLDRGGPWVIGEVLFFTAGRLSADYSLRDRVRAQRGALYTRQDIFADVDNLMGTQRFQRVTPSLHDIPGSPVPSELAGIAASTTQVRLVFDITEKEAAVSTVPVRAMVAPAISGIVMTPTAWRGAGRFTSPGLGLDFNGVYVIGRLYGKNSFPNAPKKTNYIDRVGVWLLSADGKMQVQSEGSIRPAVAVGGKGTFMFRDSPQPKVNDPNPTVTVNASQKSTKLLSDAYFVASKKLGPVRTSAGVMMGSWGDAVANFSEFLSPDALAFYANKPRGSIVSTRTMPFASVMVMPKPNQPLALEVIRFNGAQLSPWMVNLKIGYFLKLNFDVGVLFFKGGYDVLGLLQFRYNHFPKR